MSGANLARRPERDDERSRCPCWRNKRGESGGRQRRRAGRKGWIQASRDRIDTGRWFTRETELIVDFYELELGELFEARHERAGDVIQGAVRLAIACQIY